MESLKETAQRLAPDYWKRDQWNIEYFDSVGFAEALIEAYRAELLNEVGEPEYFIRDCDELRAQLAKAERLWQVAQGRCDGLEEKLAKAEQRVAEYNELIYAVQTKHHDETRHQTALRYIRNAENRPSNTAANGASS